MVARPFMNTLDLSTLRSRPNRITAKLTPRLTTGISRLATDCIRLVTPITSGLASA